MHPLNGPGWSLFYEYVGNILYALFVRKFSKLLLSLFVIATGGVLLHWCLTSQYGDLIGGWSVAPDQVRIGLTRLLYPFFAGLLLSRVVKVGHVRHAFLLSSVLIIIALAMPRLGGEQDVWMNGLYEALCIIVVFPLIVWLGAGAGGEVRSGLGARFCGFLGEISYPIYIVHFPFVYTYTAWVHDNKIPVGHGWPVAVATLVFCVLLAYLCLRFYDIPVRRWLTARYMKKRRTAGLAQPAA